MKDKKGSTKMWIEIIGGIIVVVVILIILSMSGSFIGTAVSDNHNVDEMSALFRGGAEALSEPGLSSEHTVSPFDFLGTSSGQVYAMVYITPKTAGSITEGKGIGDLLKEDDGSVKDGKQMDYSKISKCKSTAGQLDVQDISTQGNIDACACLIRFKYKTTKVVDIPLHLKEIYTCGDFQENLIVTELPPSLETFDDDPGFNIWLNEWNRIEHWNEQKFQELDSSVLEDVSVIDCKLVATEFGCSTVFEDKVMPCILHYKDDPMVWLSTKHNEDLDVEFVNIKSKLYDQSFVSKYPNIENFEFVSGSPREITSGSFSDPYIKECIK